MGSLVDLTGKIKHLNDRFYLILNDLVKTYPSAHLKDKKEQYEAHLKKMMLLQNDYFLYKNDLMSANAEIQKAIKETDDEINAIEGQNKILKIQYESLKGSSYSAQGLFDDTQISRNELLVSNFILLAAICAGGYAFYKSTFVKVQQNAAI